MRLDVAKVVWDDEFFSIPWFYYIIQRRVIGEILFKIVLEAEVMVFLGIGMTSRRIRDYSEEKIII